MKDICEKVIETDYDNLNEALGQIEHKQVLSFIIMIQNTNFC